MRKFLLTLAILAGAAVATGASAAPHAIPLAGAPAADGAALMQPVQYYPDWRYRAGTRLMSGSAATRPGGSGSGSAGSMAPATATVTDPAINGLG
jgi:hypothetical protein